MDNTSFIIRLEERFIKIYNIINKNNKITPGTRNDQVCCTDEERDNIQRYAQIIKNLPAYSNMLLLDIYIILIFIYYSLKYNEQTTDWLELRFLKPLGVFNIDSVMTLYHDITTGDIGYTDSAGVLHNLSSEIRILFLELAEGRKVRRRKVKSRRVRRNRVKSRRVRRVRRSRN